MAKINTAEGLLEFRLTNGETMTITPKVYNEEFTELMEDFASFLELNR